MSCKSSAVKATEPYPIAWSRKGHGKIASIHISKANGNSIKAVNTKPVSDSDSDSESENAYSEYLDKIMRECSDKVTDWNIFAA